MQLILFEFIVSVYWLLFTGNIPRGVFCERRSPTGPATGSFLRMHGNFAVYFAESLFQTHSKTEDFDINLQKVITCL